MTDLKELIVLELGSFFEWPGDDRGSVTTTSAMLFAEHVARLYADRVADAAPAVQGEPVSHDWDDQDKCRRCGDRDWYASATCSPKQQPAEQQTILNLSEAARSLGAAQAKDDQDAIDYWSVEVTRFEREARQPTPDVAGLVEALELALEYWRHRMQRYKNRKPRWVADAESALATHRKQGGEK